jgi:hypothetical protein
MEFAPEQLETEESLSGIGIAAHGCHLKKLSKTAHSTEE